jgi:Holliday junction resolvase-like predicted endonuclease
MVGRGEIDLIAVHRGRRVAVEVKTVVAAGSDSIRPEDAFTTEKARTVRRLANQLDPRARRVDLVAITLSEAGARVRWLRSVA